MENTGNGAPRYQNPRRRRRSPLRRFLDAYASTLLIGVAVILFIIFVAGSVSRSNARREEARQSSIAAYESSVQLQAEQELEAAALAAQAQELVNSYDYDGAIALIDNFSGNMYDFDYLLNIRDNCLQAKENLVAWSDPAQVANLSFHLLLHDPVRAYADKDYSTSYRWNFVTTAEFSAILEQLYQNGYVLVGLDDVIAFPGEDGSGYAAKTIYLPEGKKPFMLTQTQVNYYTYMTDGDGDGLPDAQGDGFASRLILENGDLTCEYIDTSGNKTTGEYDLIPILERFIKEKPGFSYQGARATLAVSGYDGLFGYRTDPETALKISQQYYEQELNELPKIVSALRDKGYLIASYTYGNSAYGKLSPKRLKEEMILWSNEAETLLGEIDILAFAKDSDISAGKDAYSGEKFNILRDAGFSCFLGYCSDSTPWATLANDHVRIGRLMVTGNNLKNAPKLFDGIFAQFKCFSIPA